MGKGKFSKGKGKGKAKGAAGASGGKGHTLPRTRISAEKFSGSVTAWKGKYGWIQPDEEIPHEKASLRNGSLFFSQSDVMSADAMAEGTMVMFHITEDDNGLGAEEVEAIGGKGARAGGKGKGATKGSSWTASTKGGPASSPFAKGAGVKGKGAAAWAAKGVKGWSAASAKGSAPFAKGKGKGKGPGTRGKGHLLPRTRITEEKFTGTVNAWKGKYGWIDPAEEIPHEKAQKNNGRLFAGMDDIVGLAELTPGATVEFHIFEDSSGLGAEEIVQY
eukprot:SRR837773.19811.p1 GENE.SRR837773.19811~~SRR837773.19811.p1  ORF type:complete len:275 (-),score=73.70 SRR837773.19811:29-853(-)